MSRVGFLHLPTWNEALRADLAAHNQEELLNAPVLDAEDADSSWNSLGADEFFDVVDLGLSFADRPPLKRVPARVITSDVDLAVRLTEERSPENLGVRGAIGGTWPLLDLCSPMAFQPTPRRLVAITDGVAAALLSIMEVHEGTLDEALAEVRWRGFVPGNPTKHLHGLIARNRLALLAGRLFGCVISPDHIFHDGLSRINSIDLTIIRQLRYRLRYLGVVEIGEKGVEAWVRPCLLSDTHPLARLDGNTEGAHLLFDDGMFTTFIGPGTGKNVALRGMLRDLAEMKDDPKCPKNGNVGKRATSPQKEHRYCIPGDEIPASFYLRLSLVNFVSTLAQVTEILARSGIELAAISQTGNLASAFSHATRSGGKTSNDLILFTRSVAEGVLRQALSRIGSEIRLAAVQACLRLESPVPENV
ncbi:MAG: hypothetical protein WA705_30580 [Candidatus Ozemobacteraceae bacterium]